MADTKSTGTKPSTGTPEPSCNQDNTPAHVLLRMGKKAPVGPTGGPKTPA